MYGKIFASMYDGSIYGKWKAIVTFQQMIALADKDGVIDITPEALSARTSIPLDIIQEGITVLESPDQSSRTPDEEGRRIIRLDEDRPWGWRITNYAKYRAIRTAEERREYHKRYYHEKRKTQNSTISTATQQIQPIAYAEANAKAEAKKKEGFRPPSLQEVTDYCLQRNNGINPSTFVDFYESKGWVIGKSKMKNWKSAIHTWEQRKKEDSKNGNQRKSNLSAGERVKAATGFDDPLEGYFYPVNE